jgi:glycerate kinase
MLLIDLQTAMGKTPVGMARLASKEQIPVIVLASRLSDNFSTIYEHGISSAFSVINSTISLEEAMNKEKAGHFITKNTEEIFRLIKSFMDKFSSQYK